MVLLAAGWTWAEGENERWIAPPAQGIDLGQLARYGHTSRYDPVAGSAESSMILVDNGEWVRLAQVRALISQRDAAPGVGQ